MEISKINSVKLKKNGRGEKWGDGSQREKKTFARGKEDKKSIKKMER